MSKSALCYHTRDYYTRKKVQKHFFRNRFFRLSINTFTGSGKQLIRQENSRTWKMSLCRTDFAYFLNIDFSVLQMLPTKTDSRENLQLYPKANRDTRTKFIINNFPLERFIFFFLAAKILHLRRNFLENSPLVAIRRVFETECYCSVHLVVIWHRLSIFNLHQKLKV